MARVAQNPPARPSPAPPSAAELAQALCAADGSAFLVPPRILRRVIKEHTHVRSFGLRVPHRKSYVISRGDLLAIVDRTDLDVESDVELPDTVILLARPTVEMLSEVPTGSLLAKYWRLLFHARVHLALEGATAEGRLGADEIRSRVQAIGETEFDEIRAVLEQEEFLLPPADERATYIEFVAVYLELRFFAASFLRSYFPSIEDYHYVDELIRQDVDAESLLAATRLAGAAEADTTADVPALDRHGWRDRFDEAQRLRLRGGWPLKSVPIAKPRRSFAGPTRPASWETTCEPRFAGLRLRIARPPQSLTSSASWPATSYHGSRAGCKRP